MATRLRRPPTDRLRTYMDFNYGAFSLADSALPHRDPPVAIWVPRVSDAPNRARILMPTPSGPKRLTCDRVLYFLFGNRRLDARIERGGINTPMQVISIARDNADAAIDVLCNAFRSVAVMRDFTATEMCTAACQRATSSRTHCECSCLGRNHGAPGSGDREWSDGSVFAYHDFQRQCYVVKSHELLDYERDYASGAYTDDNGEQLLDATA